MQQTTNYNLAKPEYTDAADIAPISGNMDTIDTALEKARSRDADVYNQNTSYAVGDFCIYQDTLYKCTGTTTGAWDNTKWTATKIADAFEPKHTWSLFETITATNETRFVYSSDLPENVTGIMIDSEVQAGTIAATLGFGFSFDGTSYATSVGVASGINTGIRYSRMWYLLDGNLWYSKVTLAGTALPSNLTLQERVDMNNITLGGEVKKVRIYAPTGQTLPDNSTFKIYLR